MQYFKESAVLFQFLMCFLKQWIYFIEQCVALWIRNSQAKTSCKTTICKDEGVLESFEAVVMVDPVEDTCCIKLVNLHYFLSQFNSFLQDPIKKQPSKK